MRPYLSVVVAARNDDYGGDFLSRLQVFVQSFLTQAEATGLSGELVIVEWNPPADRPRLREALSWPAANCPIPVRIIEVPASTHAGFANSRRLPLFEYLAKNAGIRRAAGTFVLTTNPDLLFTHELVGYLASQQLAVGAYYRADRYDFKQPNPDGRDLEIVGEARRRIYGVHIREDRRRGSFVPIGRFRRTLGLVLGLWPSSAGRGSSPVAPLGDDTGYYGGIHTNAAGDFLLAPTSAWHLIRGFSERTDTFTHLDSFACHQLWAAGLSQWLLCPPCMVLHRDHARAEQRSRPRLDDEAWKLELEAIRAGRLGPALNGDEWGLSGEQLHEDLVRG